jgi:hypothetical protein
VALNAKRPRFTELRGARDESSPQFSTKSTVGKREALAAHRGTERRDGVTLDCQPGIVRVVRLRVTQNQLSVRIDTTVACERCRDRATYSVPGSVQKLELQVTGQRMDQHDGFALEFYNSMIELYPKRLNPTALWFCGVQVLFPAAVTC